MDTRYESKVLRQLARLLDKGPGRLETLRTTCYVVSWVAIAFLVFSIAHNGIIWILIVVGAVIAGALAGVAAYASASLHQWPIVKQHLNRDSIDARLREIET